MSIYGNWKIAFIDIVDWNAENQRIGATWLPAA